MISAFVSSYDVVLAAMALPVVIGLLISAITGVSATVGLVIGGIPSLLVLGYALFVAPPPKG
ncbi:hypothetical protein [Halocatena halophila]|uniref:hypothetical protein n=1 Tax=Halocatena halophila TaxID=2814576 RepID=UPI002ED2F9CB